MNDSDPAPAGLVTAVAAKIAALFASTLAQIATGLSAAVVAVVVAFADPARDWFEDWLWPESVVVSAAPVIADEGQRVPLKLVLSDRSGSGISGGTVTITSPDRSVVVRNGTFAVARSDGSTDVAPEGLTVEPRAPGTSRLTITLVTNKGSQAIGHVEVTGNPVHADLAGENLSGSWRATLDGVGGELRIVEEARRRFRGALTMDDGTRYDVVSGWYDSRPFMFALRSDAGLIMRVEGIHCVVESADERWVLVNARVRRPQPVPSANQPWRSRFPQRCPADQPPPGQRPLSLEEELEAYEGAGTFFAAARLR